MKKMKKKEFVPNSSNSFVFFKIIEVLCTSFFPVGEPRFLSTDKVYFYISGVDIQGFSEFGKS